MVSCIKRDSIVDASAREKGRGKVRYSCRPDRMGDAVEAQEGKAVRLGWGGGVGYVFVSVCEQAGRVLCDKRTVCSLH